MPKKPERMRVDLYPPVSTKLAKEAKRQKRTASNMATVILEDGLAKMSVVQIKRLVATDAPLTPPHAHRP